jgi:hypothetical protein
MLSKAKLFNINGDLDQKKENKSLIGWHAVPYFYVIHFDLDFDLIYSIYLSTSYNNCCYDYG